MTIEQSAYESSSRSGGEGQEESQESPPSDEGQDEPQHDGLTENVVKRDGRNLLALGQAGEYEILNRLGVGGMAEVYRARKLGTAAGIELEVAIKKMRTQWGPDETWRNLFIDEARVVAMLRHRHIVKIEHFALVNNVFYFVMEFIKGIDLDHAIDLAAKKGRSLSIEFSCEVAAQLADALDYAWGQATDKELRLLRVVHRDLSPHNVMLSEWGDVKLMDFGVARSDLQLHKSRTGSVRGKPAYMSPEQIRGEALDGRSDIFALGICLAQMLTGRLIFAGNTTESTWHNILFAAPELLTEALSAMDQELRAIVERALAKDRNERFGSAGEMARALRGYLRSHDMASGPDEIASELRELARLPAIVRPADESEQSIPSAQRRSTPGRLVGAAPSKGGARTEILATPSRPRWRLMVGGTISLALVATAAFLFFGKNRGDETKLPETSQPTPAVGREEDTASILARRPHAEKAQTHFDLADYEDAAREWREAYRERPSPDFLLRLAETMKALKKYPEAKDYYSKYLGTKPDAASRQKVEQLIAELTAPVKAPSQDDFKQTRRVRKQSKRPKEVKEQENSDLPIDTGTPGVKQ